jgi:class 3 adenylate cyclase
LHFTARNYILKSTGLVQSTYILLLKDVNATQDFFNEDIDNPVFFTSSGSPNLKKHAQLKDSIITTIQKAYISFKHLPYKPDSLLQRIETEINLNSILFDTITKLLWIRGYKDFNLEGQMRQNAHRLEKSNLIPTESILSLRRHEKDYIIRNELIYVNKLNSLVDELQKKHPKKSDSASIFLTEYQQLFNRIVAFDKRIGLKDNSGLKKVLDESTHLMEASLSRIVTDVELRQDQEFRKLNIIYLSLCAFLIIGSFVISILIAEKVTKPLIELTQFITRFIDSQFTVEESSPEIKSKDEIGKLTANFTLLKDEVITHIRFFKQKVEERTNELKIANKRLSKINEANSRFVPKEFLNYLQKDSIEEVMPGDQVSREMTVLFTDIRSFTRISELLSPQENFDFINAYLEEIVPVIKKHNGFIDKFIGDSVMAIFPEPSDAIKASLEFSLAVDRFNKHMALRKSLPIVIGTGIHTGQLVLGTIGNAHRLETTVISDAVNIASRIEGLTKHYHAGIIVSEETIQKLSNGHFYHRYLGEVRVKGKLKSVRVYEILNPNRDSHKITYLDKYKSAITYMKERKPSEACFILKELALQNPEDMVINSLIERCRVLIENGFPNEWDGIESMNSK